MVLHHTMALYTTYETAEKMVSHGDALLLHAMKLCVEKAIETYTEHFHRLYARELNEMKGETTQ